MNRRILASIAATAAASSVIATFSPAVEARRVHKPVTCKVAVLDSSAAKHTASFFDGGVNSQDDWESVTALCNNENVTGAIQAKSTLTLRSAAGKRAKAPNAGAGGSIRGPIVLNYSFGASQTGSFQFSAEAPFTCAADSTCTFNGRLTRKTKPAGTIKGTFQRPASGSLGYFKVTFEDIIISS